MDKRSNDAIVGREPPPPPEAEGVADEDLADAVRERLREVGGDGLQRVVVEVHDGRVTLGGEIPNEARRAIARQIVDDITDLPFDDRMRVTIGWETSDRTPPAPPDTPEIERAEGIEGLNEDPIRAEEGDEVYDPPVGPVPDEE